MLESLGSSIHCQIYIHTWDGQTGHGKEIEVILIHLKLVHEEVEQVDS